MKIFSQIIEAPNGIPVFALYLDTEFSGNPEKDTSYAAIDCRLIEGNDPERIISQIVPMISELIYHSYGESMQKTTPLTDWHATGFDRNSVNGVKV
jgi:hypothetical protein